MRRVILVAVVLGASGCPSSAQDLIGDIVVGAFTIGTLIQVLPRPLRFIGREFWVMLSACWKTPLNSWWLPFQRWLSHREWGVVFALGNTVVFWFSMSTTEGWHLVETLLNNKLVAGQMALMLAAMALVTHQRWVRGGRSVVDFNDSTRSKRWLPAVGIAILANITAAMDSCLQLAHGDV